MKKSYFMLVCLVLFMASKATAQVSSIVDLFGKYKFTATVEFTAEGEAYKSQLPAECDAEISEDATYIAKIVGFAGSQTQQNINAISIEQSMLKVLNLNNPALWSNGLLLANENGDNPYGVWDAAAQAWAVESYGPVYYTFDPATKEISIPDFTVVKMSDYSAPKGTIIAKYTNVKMTLVEAATVEIADISGDWNFKAGSSTYSTMAGSTIPTEFAVALAKTDNAGRAYNATFAIEGFEAVTLPATFDGNSLVIAYDETYLDEVKGIRFGNINGSAVKEGSIEFKSQSAEAFSLYSGFSFVVDSIGKNKTGDADSTYVKLQQWYMDGTLKLPSEAPAFDWAGVYTVKTTDENGLYVADAAGFDWPTEFQIEVEYNEGWDMYLVTKVFGLDVVALNYGGLEFTPSEDGKKVDISTGNLYTVSPGAVYLALRDMNMSTEAIEMVVNEDGTMSVAGLSVVTVINGEESLNAFYSNLSVTKEAAEPETPVVPEEFDWAGVYTVKTIDKHGLSIGDAAGFDWPTEFQIEVEYNEGWDMYLVTKVFGLDVVALNYGGLEFTPSEDGKKVDISTGNLYTVKPGEVYLALRDMYMSTDAIEMVVNEDGTMFVAGLSVVTVISGVETQNPTVNAYYSNLLVTKEGTEPEAFDFDWLGTWEVTAGSQISYDGKEYPKSFYMTVEYREDWGLTLITQFMSKDVVNLNQGGIMLDIAADNKTAEMELDMFAGGSYPDYLKIYDLNGTADYPIILTACEDGTIFFGDFYLATYNWDTHSLTGGGVLYQGVTATKCPTGIENIVVENAVVEGIYDMQGRKIEAITAPGLYIVGGKKVLVK